MLSTLSTVRPSVRLSPVAPQRRALQFQGETPAPVKQPAASSPKKGFGVLNFIGWVLATPARYRAAAQATEEAQLKAKIKTCLEGAEAIFQSTLNCTPVVSNQKELESGSVTEPTKTYSGTVAYGDKTYDVTVVNQPDAILGKVKLPRAVITIAGRDGETMEIKAGAGSYNYSLYYITDIAYTPCNGTVIKVEGDALRPVFTNLGLKLAKLVVPQTAAQA